MTCVVLGRGVPGKCYSCIPGPDLDLLDFPEKAGCAVSSAIERVVPLKDHHTVLEPTVDCFRPKLPVDLFSVEVAELVKYVYHILISVVVDMRMPPLVEHCPGEDVEGGVGNSLSRKRLSSIRNRW